MHLLNNKNIWRKKQVVKYKFKYIKYLFQESQAIQSSIY